MSTHALQSHGPQWLGETRVRFRLWAPAQREVELILGDRDPSKSHVSAGGWHEWIADDATAGTRYRFRLGTGETVPDPASRFQPEGVHGPSELVAPQAHAWGDTAWTGRPWREAIVYELHVGTFTPAGSFLGVVDQLDHLVALGVTAVQLMPVAAFPGTRNWGYDGVFPFACAASYGRPEALAALVDAAHARGLMVLLDVVHNHLGPEGNYLHLYAPQFFSTDDTPWGAGIDFDGAASAPVREFFIQSAVHWIERFHFDGLRLDAVHAIRDRGPRHFLDELAARVRAAASGRHVHLVLENLANQATLLRRTSLGEAASYTAQWNDDLHHALHSAITGEREGYYVDFAGDTPALGRALAEGFAFQGQRSKYRGRNRGEPSAHLPPESFVAFLQNHDQIGNRWLGERIDRVATAEARRAATAIVLLSPQVPLLFMGEEWNAPEPFPFFCDYRGELAEAVRRGRVEKCTRLAPHGPVDSSAGSMRDPSDPSTFLAARLDWEKLARREHDAMLDWYRRILLVRRTRLWPVLPRLHAHGGRFELSGRSGLRVEWGGFDCLLRLELNLGDSVGGPVLQDGAERLWLEGGIDGEGCLLPWTVCWSLRDESNRPSP